MPRVAAKVISDVLLTGGHVLAVGDEVQHLLVHLDKAVLRERLLLLSLLQGFLDLELEEVGLDGVDDLCSEGVRNY